MTEVKNVNGSREGITVEYINKSKTYILPLLGDIVDIQYPNLILNTYLYVEGIELEEDYIAILYKYDPDYKIINDKRVGFPSYEVYLKEHPSCLNVIDVDDCVLFIFKIPNEYKDTYIKFLNGQYSKFNNTSKIKILKFIQKKFPKEKGIYSNVRNVLMKSDQLRLELEDKLGILLEPDSELSSKIDLECETFNINLYK